MQAVDKKSVKCTIYKTLSLIKMKASRFVSHTCHTPIYIGKQQAGKLSQYHGQQAGSF